jgi:hypothetical protein
VKTAAANAFIMKLTRKAAGDMVKRQDMQLYYVVLLTFKQAKLKGCSNEEAFEQAKTTLIDYFVSTGNVNKHSFAIIWGEMKKQHFTQQLYLDYQLLKKKETALSLRGLM